jgi:hypothetical protein
MIRRLALSSGHYINVSGCLELRSNRDAGGQVASGRSGTVPAFENQITRLDEGAYISFARPTWARHDSIHNSP